MAVSSFAGRCVAACLLALLLSVGVNGPSRASGRASLMLSAAPEVILADGKSTTTVTATVRDGNGNLAADGTTVRFTTSLGTLDKDAVTTSSGTARITLTSAAAPGMATISATSFLSATDGSSTGSAQIEFTNDRDAVYSTGDSRWVRVDCAQYLVYSADAKIVEAEGRHGTAHLEYKGLDITADALQLDLQSLLLLARNATLQRGLHVLKAAELRYDLSGGVGTAVLLADSDHAARGVQITGLGLQTGPLDETTAQGNMQSNLYRFADISDSHVIVSARALSAAPGDRVQFQRASIYSDGKKIVSLPFQVMPIGTEQLFGQQLVGFGSQGFFLNVPFYYHVSPRSTGTLFLRNSAAAGADSNGFGLSAPAFSPNGTRPGLALDLDHTYSLGKGGSGDLSVTGLTRSEWGAHWNHTQRLDDVTNSYLFVDYPAHRSLYASSSISRQFSGFSLNLAANGSRDPGFLGYSSSNATASAYLQTTPRELGQSGINVAADLTAQQGQLVQTTPTTGRQVIPISTHGLDFRFFTAPLHPDHHTNLTDGVTVGQSWNASGQHSLTVLGTMGLTRTMSGHGNLNLNYTYRYDPLLSQLSAAPSPSNPLGSLYRSASQQRLSLNYSVAPRPRLSVSVTGSYGLPLSDSNLFALMSYRVNTNWALAVGSSWDRYASARYQETDLSVSRRILGRDLILTYSTQTKKVGFDIGSAGF